MINIFFNKVAGTTKRDPDKYAPFLRNKIQNHKY